MDSFAKIVRELVANGLVPLLSKFLDAVLAVFRYLGRRQDAKDQKKAETAVGKAEKKVDDACDKGGIGDLFDAAAELAKAKKKGIGK